MQLISKLNQHLAKQKPFVVYRKPNSEWVRGIFMDSDELVFTSNFNQQGFVFAPFNAKESSVFFPLDQSEILNEKQSVTKGTLSSTRNEANSIDEKTHIDLVERAILAIKDSEIKKIVVSRKETVSIDSESVATIFSRLLNRYANAFVYCWYHPKIGLWLGASPETLVKVQKDTLISISLAGTQPYKEGEDPSWTDKEIKEQQMVTDYILAALQGKVADIEVMPRKTVRAGNLYHLKTRIEAKLQPHHSLEEILSELHPTPAVCGLPKHLALDFINANEGYNRSFYTGYLGELNFSSENQNSRDSHFFVNLRCMNIDEEKANIYVGGGITKDSIPEKEWEETVNKAKTIKDIL